MSNDAMERTAPTNTYKTKRAAKGAMVAFFFAIKKASETPGDSDWKPGGFKRGLQVSDSYDSIDVTGDTDFEEGNYKQSIPGFREATVSVDFVCRGDTTGENAKKAADGQKTLWKHLKDPGVTTDKEPVVWLKWFHPVYDTAITQCFTATNVSDDLGYADALTFSADLTAVTKQTLASY